MLSKSASRQAATDRHQVYLSLHKLGQVLTFQLVKGKLAHDAYELLLSRSQRSNYFLLKSLLKMCPISSSSFHLCNIAMLDTAEECSKYFKRKISKLLKTAVQGPRTPCNLYPRGEKLSKRETAKNVSLQHYLSLVGLHLLVFTSREKDLHSEEKG